MKTSKSKTAAIKLEFSHQLLAKCKGFAQIEGVSIEQFIFSCIFESLNDGPYSKADLRRLTVNELMAFVHSVNRGSSDWYPGSPKMKRAIGLIAAGNIPKLRKPPKSSSNPGQIIGAMALDSLLKKFPKMKSIKCEFPDFITGRKAA